MPDLRQHIRFLGRDCQPPLAECAYIAERRPADFLCFLAHERRIERLSVLGNAHVLIALRNTRVRCKGR